MLWKPSKAERFCVCSLYGGWGVLQGLIFLGEVSGVLRCLPRFYFLLRHWRWIKYYSGLSSESEYMIVGWCCMYKNGGEYVKSIVAQLAPPGVSNGYIQDSNFPFPIVTIKLKKKKRKRIVGNLLIIFCFVERWQVRYGGFYFLCLEYVGLCQRLHFVVIWWERNGSTFDGFECPIHVIK